MKKGTKKNKQISTKSSTTPIKAVQTDSDSVNVKETYEEVVYSSKAFANTSIASLAGRAKIMGLQTAPLKGAKVLELGCSFGGNIISQALYHPDTQFVGVDLSSTQIKQGMEIIESMNLTNIRLEEKNILDIDESFGIFDYIIVHGIWSWVPDIVKDKILNICNVNLSDHGVAYVSYNTYPGWKRLEQFRDIMLYSTKDKQDMSLADRTVYGKEVLQLLGQTMNMDHNVRENQGYKIRNLETVLGANDYYVAHEYFEIFNDPVYFHEFATRAVKQGCAYIGDCAMTLSYATWLPDGIKDNIIRLAGGDYIAKEQYIDYIYDTQFRCSLLTKGSNEPMISRNEEANTNTLRKLHFRTNESSTTPNDETNTFYHAVKVVMDHGESFTAQDVVDYLAQTYPGLAIDEGAILARLFYLTIVNKLRPLDEVVPFTAFEDNITYVPERFINYVAALVEGTANTYIAPANMLNESHNNFDVGMLYVMRLLATPMTKRELVEKVGVDLTVTRKTKDGFEYRVSAEQYVDEVLATLRNFSYLVRQ